MIETINPAVCGTRKRFIQSVLAYLVGSTLGGAVTTAVAAALLAAAGGPGVLGALITVCAIGIAILRDLGANMPTPYRQGQVPEWLRDLVPLPVTGFVFGFQLGVGFLTHFTTSAHLTVVMLSAWVALKSPTAAILIVLMQAAAKTLTLIIVPRSFAQQDVEWLIAWDSKGVEMMRLATAATSSAVAVGFLAEQGWMW